MTDSAQVIVKESGGTIKENTTTSPDPFEHPSLETSSTLTPDSPTMDALVNRMNDAIRLSEGETTEGEPACPESHPRDPMNGPCSNGVSAGRDHKKGQGVRPASHHRTTGCTSGYIPSPGPKELPNTNMDDVAKVDHVEEAQRHEQTHFMAVPIDVVPPSACIPEYDLHLLNLARHADPFKMLGCHEVVHSDGEKRMVVVRAWLKNASHVELRPRAGVSDWRLPPPLESVMMERTGELLFQKARASSIERTICAYSCLLGISEHKIRTSPSQTRTTSSLACVPPVFRF